MKLRHKKPLNSYKGQTNNDKNEINDDDFRQQGSPFKKNQPHGADQNYRYAHILVKFIKNVNQSYREYASKNSNQSLRQEHRKGSGFSSMEIQNEKEQSFSKKDQFQQLKQISKYQSKNQFKNQNKETGSSYKKRQPKIKTNTTKDSKYQQMQIENARVSVQRSNKISVQGKPKQLSLSKKDKNISQVVPPIENNMQYMVQNPIGMINPSQMNILYNNLIPMNRINGAQAVLGQNPQMNLINLTNLNALNGLNSLNALNGLNGINGINGLNGINLQYLLRYNNFLSNTDQFKNNFQNVLPLNNKKLSSYKNLFLTQAEEYIKNDKKEVQMQKIYPLKRSAYHISISYKIYLDNLKKKGVNMSNISDIDPTNNSKIIKNNNYSIKSSNKKFK